MCKRSAGLTVGCRHGGDSPAETSCLVRIARAEVVERLDLSGYHFLSYAIRRRYQRETRTPWSRSRNFDLHICRDPGNSEHDIEPHVE